MGMKRTSCPVAAFKMRTPASGTSAEPAAAIKAPSGETAITWTYAVRSNRLAHRCRPSTAFHTRTVASPPAVTMDRPPSAYATARTALEWESDLGDSRSPVVVLHSPIALPPRGAHTVRP